MRRFKAHEIHLGSVCYNSVQNLWPSHLLSKKVKSKIHKTIILSVVFYGCERYRTQPEGVEENTGNYGGGWRKVHNDELHNLYTSSDIIRIVKSMRMRCVGHVACMGEIRNAHKVFV
jgi:hypothetical protein